MSISNILQKLNSRDTQLTPQFPKISKKNKLFLFITIFTFSIILSHQILAVNETTTIDKSSAVAKFKEKQTAIENGNNQESWMNESIMSNAMSINQAIAGTIPDNILAGKSYQWIPGGMIGFTNQSIAYLYNSPASGVQYIAQTFNNFLGKPAYAATGYDGLKGIQDIWKSFRNTVYILFSVIFIGIGIAIMLRVKISQQAVISIQSAIPALVTSLVLVTFSYAIAGLLIDLSYVFQGLVLTILFNSKTTLFSSGINPTFAQLMDAGWWDFYKLSLKAVPLTALTLLAGIPSGIIAGVISAVTFGAGAPLAIGVGAIGFILTFLIILIMILVYIIKFFFGMIKCYINLILRIILAPLEIGMGAIPNSKMNFSSWIWQVIANLAVFPISLIFLVLINMIIDSVNTSNLWAPPMLGGSWLLCPVIGISALMLLSKLPSLIPEFIFNLKPSPFGKAIGEGLSPFGKAARGGARYGVNRGGDIIGTRYGTDEAGGVTASNASEGVANTIRRMTGYFTKK